MWIDGLIMRRVTIELMRPHCGQAEVLANLDRFNVLCCGRRWGKTLLAQHLALRSILDGLSVAYIAPVYRQTRDAWREITAKLSAVAAVVSEQDKTFTALTGGKLLAYSLDNPNTIRGVGVDWVIVDEAAFAPKLEDAWNKVLRPMLTDRLGRALFISTPNGVDGYFYELYQRGMSGEKGWRSFRYPTSGNPWIAADELLVARRELPGQVYDQEYEALFVALSGGVFGDVAHALTREVAHPQPGTRVVGGVDWGQEEDYTALSLMRADDNREVALMRWRRMNWVAMRAAIVEACRYWGVEKLVVERNSASANYEDLVHEARAAGLDMTIEGRSMTAPLKAKLVTRLYNGIHRDGLKLLDDPSANQELLAYVARQTATGMWSYSHPEGGHDDTVDARLWAYDALTRVIR